MNDIREARVLAKHCRTTDQATREGLLEYPVAAITLATVQLEWQTHRQIS